MNAPYKSNKNSMPLLLLLAAVVMIGGYAAYHVLGKGGQGPVAFEPELQGEMEAMEVLDVPYRPEMTYIIAENGEEVPLSSLRGQWHLVNLWATWCAPCVVELPLLAELHNSFDGRGLKVVAVNMDNRITDERLNNFIEDHGIASIAGIRSAGRSVKETLDITMMPTTFLMDPDGYIRARFEGEAQWSGLDAVMFVESFVW